MATNACPDHQTLHQLLLGSLPADQQRQLEDHLRCCPQCAAEADTVSAENNLTITLQTGRAGRSDDSSDQERRQSGETLNADQTDETQVATQLRAEPLRAQIDENLDFLAPAEQPGEIGRLGGYRVQNVLGVGGMGVVFRAEDPRLERQIALKAMKPSVAVNRAAKDRFMREAKATAAIEHDHIVTIHQVGEDRGVPFIAMQFLRGESLQARLKRDAPLDEREVMRIGREIAEGLQAAHQCGLVHRDIKPDNIWLEEGSGRVKIVDFGLVRSTNDDAGLTQSGTVLGTPRYMAPEQAQGQPVDDRCDLFSLGALLYHTASGKLPFAESNLTASLFAVAQKDPVPLSELSPEIDSRLADLITRLLSKDREQRPQTAAEVAATIAEIESQAAAEPRQDQRQQRAKPAFMVPKSVLVGGGVVLCLTIVFGLMASGWFSSADSRTTPRPLSRLDAQPTETAGETAGETGGETGGEMAANGIPAIVREVVQPGKYALYFDGQNARVEIPTLKIPAGPFSIEAIVEVASLPERMKLATFVSDEGGGFFFSANSKSGFSFLISRDRRFAGNELSEAYAIGERVHVRGVHDGRDLILAANGKQTTHEIEPFRGSVGHVVLGTSPNVRTWFQGRILELRISKVARYRQQRGANVSFERDEGTLALYHFDEGQGKQLYDASGNENHGTIYGAQWVPVVSDDAEKK